MFVFREEKKQCSAYYRKHKTIHLFKLSRCGLLLCYFKTLTYLVYGCCACGSDKKSRG